MTRELADTPRGDRIEAEISGDITDSQVAIGSGNTQIRTSAQAAPVTEAELAELRTLLAQLREQAVAQAPPAQKQAAAERVDELGQAVLAPQPDRKMLTRMEYTRDWFVEHLPALAGTVTAVVVNPIVGKLVEAGGDALAAEFRRRFGLKS